MTTTILSGAELARQIRASVSTDAAALGSMSDIHPRLAVVVATDDESSAWYVRSIAKTAARSGLLCDIVEPGAAGILGELESLSADPTVHGIILQTPLPAGARFEELAAAISPEKDVDGANPLSLGRLTAGLPAHPPATAAAVMALLDHYEIPLAGRRVVVVGRSNVVGKPVAHLLLARDATVTICHSRTADLAQCTRSADVLVAAVGRPGLITAEHVNPHAVVIDVGTNPTADGGLVGDVDQEAVSGRAAALTPVPGGVGPVTTALLLRHTINAATPP
ncbi:bifunctional 5,10-methylenetetrahydrofolate dehydrogenase/5,10-methenyltetrahydrofolate cyclohydrolase [Actinophytocola sp.]|uniref:bifunctional 5,10-methylenetetrahydrofolate dehydrogenase/5,10-methenyltetrahydrofolate cyclohydrolase n=1 Tax=Actinophytocola sp. TaxID=1872138 RepID=UPI002ED17614